MQQIKLSASQSSGLSQFLLPFGITFGAGLLVLLLYARSPGGKIANAPASSPKDKQASSQLAATGMTDNGAARTADGLTDSVSRDFSDADPSGGAVASTEQPPDQGIWYEDAANRRNLDTRSPGPSTSRYAAASNTTAASAFYESGASSATTPVRSAGSSSAPGPDPVSLPDPDAVPYNYPPRRIAWHQGFSVEQQWYRSWYGWGGSETP